jgi:CDP-glucose 4,6-dehydratase
MNSSTFSRFKGRRVLVTGATGFKGSWLCTWLLSLGAEVSGFALPPTPDAPLFDQLRLRDRIDQHDGDIRSGETVRRVLATTRPEIIIHLAAQPLVRRSYDEPKLTFDTNVAGAINLLDAVREDDGLRALVFATSDKAYRNREWVWGYRENDELGGHDPYSASKAAAELVFAGYQDSFFAGRKDFGAASVRAGNVIGGGDFSADRIVPDCIRAFQADAEIVLRNPLSTRPWQHVLEPLSGYLSVADRLLDDPDGAAGAWNFGPDAENVRTVQELAETALDILGAGRLRIEYSDARSHEAGLLMLNSDKAKTKLNWRCRWDFDHAVRHTVLWYKRVHEGEDPVVVTESHLAAFLEADP